MFFQRWMKYGFLSSALLVLPLQSAFASGAQWRPVNSVSPAAYAADGRLQRSAAHIRFRPVNHLRRPAPLPSMTPPAAPQPPMRPAMPHQPPAFARQFAWRPAPTHHMPHSAPVSTPYTARNQMLPMSQTMSGGWRPVTDMQMQDSEAMPVAAAAEFPGIWRPVGHYNSVAEPTSGTGLVNRPATEPGSYTTSLPQHYQQRLPAAYGYPAQPYMMPMAGAYLPPPPMPYPHAPHYGMPYPAYPPVVPPAPVWGWQPPMPLPMYPPTYPPQSPGLYDDASLAGCPSC